MKELPSISFKVPFSRNPEWYPYRGVEYRMPHQFETEEPYPLIKQPPPPERRAEFPFETGEGVK